MPSPVHRRTSSTMLFFFSQETFSFYFTLNCSQKHAVTLLFQWQYLESFRCLISSKMPSSTGIPIFSGIHVLAFRSVQLILSIRRHTHISKVMAVFKVHQSNWWNVVALLINLKFPVLIVLPQSKYQSSYSHQLSSSSLAWECHKTF